MGERGLEENVLDRAQSRHFSAGMRGKRVSRSKSRKRIIIYLYTYIIVRFFRLLDVSTL